MCHFIRVSRRLCSVKHQHHFVEWVYFFSTLNRFANRSRVIHRGKFTGSRIRRMRADKTCMREPSRILGNNPINQVVSQEVADTHFNRAFIFCREKFQNSWRSVVSLSCKKFSPRIHLPCQVECAFKTWQDSFICLKTRVISSSCDTGVNRLICVSEKSWVVPGTSCGKCNVVKPFIKRCSVCKHSMIHLVHARVQRCTAWRTR